MLFFSIFELEEANLPKGYCSHMPYSMLDTVLPDLWSLSLKGMTHKLVLYDCDI